MNRIVKKGCARKVSENTLKWTGNVIIKNEEMFRNILKMKNHSTFEDHSTSWHFLYCRSSSLCLFLASSHRRRDASFETTKYNK